VTYIITSGSGILTTGGVIENKKAGSSVPNVVNGPAGSGTAGRGAYSRKVQTGDMIIIPTGVAHGWSQITDLVTYLSVRPDPDRVLPAGWVYPTLLKSGLTRWSSQDSPAHSFFAVVWHGMKHASVAG
jgi:hypothetical protein